MNLLATPTTSTTGHLQSAKQRALDYFVLTKPGINSLLLVTTLGGMLAARSGQLSFGLIFWTLIGGALCAAGAMTLNSFLDWDIDQVMTRTRRRPVPTGRVSRESAFIFGATLAVLSIVVFVVFVNLISAALATVALVYYVWFYSAYLKRTTYHNIVIGGAAGAFPPMIGWTAVTGVVDPAGLFLFLIVFFWTPPHAWALALLMKDDYFRANIPMLPVVFGETETYRQVLLYSMSMFAITLIPAGMHLFGTVYLVTAVVLGGIFLLYAARLVRRPSQKLVLRLYRYSTIYLALLFLGLVLDKVIPL